MEQTQKATRITISLDSDIYIALADYARSQDASLSWVARRAIKEFLNKHLAGKQHNLALGLDE